MNILLHGFLVYFPFPVYFSKFQLLVICPQYSTTS
jgi:hypothetical protein